MSGPLDCNDEQLVQALPKSSDPPEAHRLVELAGEQPRRAQRLREVRACDGLQRGGVADAPVRRLLQPGGCDGGQRTC